MSTRTSASHGLTWKTLIASLAIVGAAQAQAPRQTLPIPQPGQQFPARQVDGEAPRGGTPAAAAGQSRLTPQQRAQLEAQLDQERAQLDQVLEAWERESKKVKTLSAGFRMWEYNAAFGPAPVPGQQAKATRECEGEIYFAAPDRGMYHEKMEGGAYWVCDGKSIYEVRHRTKELVEYVLPEELRGKAIADGPLPFVFGADAAKMKQRYFMRVITPDDVKGQIWLEAAPKLQQDAANFRKIEVILDEATMLPVGLQLFEPNGKDRKVFAFGKPKINDLWEKIKNFFDPPLVPRGYKRVVEQPPIAQNDVPPGGGQAQRVPPPNNKPPTNKR